MVRNDRFLIGLPTGGTFKCRRTNKDIMGSWLVKKIGLYARIDE
jgi:hypothetical protein